MRVLNKNRRPLYYANPTGEQRVTVGGVITPDMETLYSTPTLLKVNYSASTGQETTEIFGDATRYSKVIALTNNPMKEGTILWIEKEPYVSGVLQKANYRVERVATSINSTLLALMEIL